MADRQLLHACRLSLVHPVTGRLRQFEIGVPEDFARVLSFARQYYIGEYQC
jgi:hypothetical protein